MHRTAIKSLHKMMDFMFYLTFLLVARLGESGVESACPDSDITLQAWSDPASWDTDSLPSVGSNIVIDRPVLLDVINVTASEISIVGNGRLVFSDQVGSITITTGGILIQDNGSLVIGSEDCRFQNNVNISITGSRTTNRATLDAKGEKYIAVQDEGSLQIYGQDKLSWTKLTQTAERWDIDEHSIVYNHADSPNYGSFPTKLGPAVYIFNASFQPINYKVFDISREGDIPKELKVAGKMTEMLKASRNISEEPPHTGYPETTNATDNKRSWNQQARIGCKYLSGNNLPRIKLIHGVQDGDIVAMAIQKTFDVTADIEELFTTLENLTGLDYIGLRVCQGSDAYSLVFQKGGDVDEAYEPAIGRKRQDARSSIFVDNKKITAISSIRPSRRDCEVQFRIFDASSAFPTISVLDDVNSWQIGDEIILTSTDYSMEHTEVRKIKEITNSNTLILSDVLDYRHFGEIEDGVDMRAEVALLTRNVKIEGVMSRGCPANNENCENVDYDTYGAHTKIMGFSSIHIEGVEYVNVGQTTDKGFYPIHFHMCHNVSGREAIIKANSIHNSYARAVTVHGTWGNSEEDPGVEVLNNVAYEILGHCYFLEDGAEIATILDGNLGATIRSVIGNGFVTDRSGPSVFWITNPKVILTNNVGVGADGFGIWYVFPDEPVGPSEGLGVFRFLEARRTALWTFDNNVVHSNVKGGMNFDNVLENEDGDVAGCMNYKPAVDPFDRESEWAKVQLTRLTAYKNFKINTWLRGGLFELIQYSSAESRRGLQLARGSSQQQFVTKSIMVGRSRGNYEDHDYPDAPEDMNHFLGVVFYDGPIYIEKTWFNGFETVADEYAGAALGFNPRNKFTSSIVSNVTDLRFGFVDKADGSGGNRVFDGTTADELLGFGNFDGDESATFRDGDGSVTQCPGMDWSRPLQVVKPERIALNDNCVHRGNWQMMVCRNNYGKIKIEVDSDFGDADGHDFVTESQAMRLNLLDPTDVAYEDHTGMTTSEFLAILGSSKYYYQLQFVQDFPEKVTLTAKGVERDYPAVVGICLPEGITLDDISLVAVRPPPTPRVRTPEDGWIEVDTIEKLFEDNTMSRVYMEGRSLYVKFVNTMARDPHWNKWDTDNCPTGDCPFLSVKILKDNITDYTPCFTPTEEELNAEVDLDSVPVMDCELPASTPDLDWGAGDTRRPSVESQWGDWTAWSDCCGAEETYRYRLCDYPTPHGAASDCGGSSNETDTCSHACPVDGVLTQWGRWSDCFCDGIATGSYGAKTRTRDCNVANNGEFCMAALTESRPCYGDCG